MIPSLTFEACLCVLFQQAPRYKGTLQDDSPDGRNISIPISDITAAWEQIEQLDNLYKNFKEYAQLGFFELSRVFIKSMKASFSENLRVICSVVVCFIHNPRVLFSTNVEDGVRSSPSLFLTTR